MSVTIELNTSGFELAFARYVQGTGRDAEQAARMATRIFMRNVVAITPPGDGAQASDRAALTKADERRGRASILGDLARLFVSVRLRGKRPEEWPDVAGLHRHAFITGKTPGKRIKRVGNPKYVDQAKVKALTRALFAKIGRLAASWLAGAEMAGAKGMPAWVKRHGMRGRGSITPPGEPKFYFEAINPDVPTAIAAELDRRIGYAAFYTGKNLDRQLQAVLTRRAAQFHRAA
jgi:hypothetical protein